jgi:hypothetical protein
MFHQLKSISLAVYNEMLSLQHKGLRAFRSNSLATR